MLLAYIDHKNIDQRADRRSSSPAASSISECSKHGKMSLNPNSFQKNLDGTTSLAPRTR